MKARIVGVFVCLMMLGGCGSLSKIDMCSALDMLKLGHVGAAVVSDQVCQRLSGEAKKKCIAERALIVKGMDALLGRSADSAAKCEVE